MNHLNKFRRDKKRQKQLAKIQGHGLYLYQNITHADLILPRPTTAGVTRVGPRCQFVGDSYYKSIGDLICLKEMEAPMQENKLLTEVPPSVTPKGVVEFVEEKKPATKKPLIENNPATFTEDPILLTEDPLEGVRIVF